VSQFVDPAGHVAVQFAALGIVSVALNTGADVIVAYAAGSVRTGVAGRPGLVRRLREASGAGMVVLGLGLLLARRPAT
jgi:threonine/homoserine/homoserine lactone efflux protein